MFNLKLNGKEEPINDEEERRGGRGKEKRGIDFH